MKTLVQYLIGDGIPMILLTIMMLAYSFIYLQPIVAIKMGKMASLKFGVLVPILMIIVSLIKVDWIFSFFWGFALIYTLEQIRKEKEKV